MSDRTDCFDPVSVMRPRPARITRFGWPGERSPDL